MRSATDLPAGAARPSSITRLEWFVATGLMLVWLALCVIAAFHYRIDSDETQHLHVVWGWTHGLMPYRDIFDNHAPLFQMLMAPLLSLLPERPETILWMRLAMLPMHAACLWAVYLIGCRVFTRRVGIYAALVAAFIPSYFLCSTEFRTDDLWNVFWLFGIVALCSDRRAIRSAFLTGLLFGGALAVSMKTILLLACLGGAGVLACCFALAGHSSIDWRILFRCVGAGLAGFIVIPCAVIACFAVQQNLSGLYYGTVRHNVLGLGSFVPHTRPFLEWLAAIVAGAWCIFLSGRRDHRFARTLLAGGAAIYLDALFNLWPLLEREHFLPFFPLAALSITGGIFALCSWVGRQWSHREALAIHAAAFARWGPPALVALLVGFEASFLWGDAQFPIDKTQSGRELIRETLALTGSDEYVIDLKGETVFRQRANFYVEEPLTVRLQTRGLIADDTAERAIAMGVMVAKKDSRYFTHRTREFLDANYLPAGMLRVAGKVLFMGNLPAGRAIAFSIRIPGEYSFISGGQGITGTLDGARCEGVVHLAAGNHEFVPASASSSLCVLWDRAVRAKLAVTIPLAGESPAPKVPSKKGDATLHKLLF